MSSLRTSELADFHPNTESGAAPLAVIFRQNRRSPTVSDRPGKLPAAIVRLGTSMGARVHEAQEMRVGIVGCGRMGCAIAGEFVRRGCHVVLYDHTEYTRNRAFQTLRASLWDHVANGYLLKQDVEELMGRIGVAQTLEETLDKSEMVIESVFEDATLKRDLFNQMAAILQARAVPPDQIMLCSNTMTLPMQALVEDIQQKEYRGSCIGMRFLHPVWFVDEVELTDCDYTRRNTAERAEALLRRLAFQPFLFDGINRRKLTLQEISTYQSRQRLRWCATHAAEAAHAAQVAHATQAARPTHPATKSRHKSRAPEVLACSPPSVCVCRCFSASPEPITALPRRGVRKKFATPGSPSGEAHPAGSDEHSVGEAAVSISDPITSATPEDLEPCAVCLEEPRSALLVPCGHMAMCIECADKVLHGTRPICVVCRQPIEKILRATPPP